MYICIHVQISDFGMSRSLDNDSIYYIPKNAKFPGGGVCVGLWLMYSIIILTCSLVYIFFISLSISKYKMCVSYPSTMVACNIECVGGHGLGHRLKGCFEAVAVHEYGAIINFGNLSGAPSFR